MTLIRSLDEQSQPQVLKLSSPFANFHFIFFLLHTIDLNLSNKADEHISQNPKYCLLCISSKVKYLSSVVR